MLRVVDLSASIPFYRYIGIVRIKYVQLHYVAASKQRGSLELHSRTSCAVCTRTSINCGFNGTVRHRVGVESRARDVTK